MFLKKTYNEIILNIEPRKHPIKNLTKILVSDENYKNFLVNFKEIEFTADILIFDYEESINENSYLQNNYHDISELIWIMGRSGQGDEWFIDKKTNDILFYDHNLGEYQDINDFINLNINFEDFIVMSDLYRQLEGMLDSRETSEFEKEEFIRYINSINSNLYEIYPYKYF